MSPESFMELRLTLEAKKSRLENQPGTLFTWFTARESFQVRNKPSFLGDGKGQPQEIWGNCEPEEFTPICGNRRPSLKGTLRLGCSASRDSSSVWRFLRKLVICMDTEGPMILIKYRFKSQL